MASFGVTGAGRLIWSVDFAAEQVCCGCVAAPCFWVALPFQSSRFESSGITLQLDGILAELLHRRPICEFMPIGFPIAQGKPGPSSLAMRM